MHLLSLATLCVFWLVVFGLDEEFLKKPGSCSKKCQNITSDYNQTTEVFQKFPCSCSSSCTLYKDCCYDSINRNQGVNLQRSYWMCLSVAGKGQYLAISKCSKDWSEPSHFCTDSTGYLPPVTSMLTGATFANIYCAICNGDDENLKTWSVDLRCCSEHENSNDERRFVYRKGNLWSELKNKGQCICKYHARHNASFLDALELRTCDRRQEIAKCSSSWHNASDERMCKSFLDPVYLGSKIYRNPYCARCNYKKMENVQCEPAIVGRMRLEGADSDEIFQYCVKHRLRSCLHYLMSFNRGRSYSFSKLLSIREQSCIPDPGQRCCANERYDFRAKRCRKLMS